MIDCFVACLISSDNEPSYFVLTEAEADTLNSYDDLQAGIYPDGGDNIGKYFSSLKEVFDYITENELNLVEDIVGIGY